MTQIFHTAILKWDTPFTSVQELVVPFTPVQSDFIEPIACSGDGSVIVANFFDDANNIVYPVRWSGGNTLGTVIGTNVFALLMSNDGTTIYGQAADQTPYVWVGAATSPTTLTPPVGYNRAFAHGAISDDGSIIYGYCQNTITNALAIVEWVNTVPTAITFGPDHQTISCCSNDGSIAVGGNRFGSSTIPGYYLGGTFHRLAAPSGGSTAFGRFCNGAGTIIYGTGSDSVGRGRLIQWTNISTITGTVGGVSVYGTANLLDIQLAGAINAAANDVAVAVGYIASFENFFPVRWAGTAITNLNTVPLPNYTTYGLAFSVSGDGSVACGQGSSPTVNDASAYFDSLNVTHILPVPEPFPNGSNSAELVSRDGSVIIGTATWFTDSPTPPPTNSWEFRSGTADSEAGVGQMWFDSSYVDFADPTVLAKFVNPDGTWVDLGDFGQLPTGTSPLNFLNVETSDPYNITYGYGQDGNQNSWNLDSIGNDPLTGEPYDDLVFDICGPELKLVSLYPMAAPGAEYAFRNIQGGDFPIAFSQFSLSIWCCEHVNIRLPNGIDGQSSINMALTPSSAVIQINDAANDVLFSGSFTNPGTATSEYHVMFSIDTQAQTYTLWIASDGPAVQWTTTDAAFGILGDINNVIGA